MGFWPYQNPIRDGVLAVSIASGDLGSVSLLDDPGALVCAVGGNGLSDSFTIIINNR